jgi:uncharacterized protein
MFAPLLAPGAKTIDSLDASGFTVVGQIFAPHLLIMGDHVQGVELPDSAAPTMAHLAALLALPIKPDLILLGTGRAHRFIPPALRSEIKSQGIAFETMDTVTACRTYNVLLAEGRLIAGLMMGVFD